VGCSAIGCADPCVIFTGIITLIFALSFDALLLGVSEITGGDSGRSIETGSVSLLRELIPPYYVMLGLVLLFLVVHGLLRRSHVGWAFRALRDDEVAAELAGIDVARYRVYAALVGAAMLGLAGATYAFSAGRVSPATFAFAHVDVVVIVMLAFGGIGTLFGRSGAVTSPSSTSCWSSLASCVFIGVLVIALFLWIPRGVIPTVASLWQRLNRSTN
jgi:branched-chain amino acid transport system permease protein